METRDREKYRPDRINGKEFENASSSRLYIHKATQTRIPTR